MAKSKESPTAKYRKPADEKPQFLNYDLSDEEKRRFKAWAHENAMELLNLLEKLIDDGYQFSVKFDSFNDCIAAFIVCKNEKSENAGWILTGRGSTAFSASMGALYRHYVIFEGQWPIESISRRGNLDDM